MSGKFFGNVSPQQAWQGLVDQPEAVLIDVRTKAEWAYVGGPDLSGIERPVFQIEWQHFPSSARNPGFAQEVAANGIRPGTPVYLICRSGVRSLAAADLLAGLGHTTYNVAEGFEGNLDASGHRGTGSGWKAAGLPWRQN